EGLGRGGRGEEPRVERRHVDIAVAVHRVLAPEDVGPTAALVNLQDFLLGRVLAVKRLEVVRRAEQEEGRGARLAFDEMRVGLGPAVADRPLVDDLDLGRLAVDGEFDGWTGRRQFAVVGYILPE